MLLSRWKDLFSKNFYKKSETFSGGSSFGFFVFWNFVFTIVATIGLIGLMVFGSNKLVEVFSDDFAEFRVAYNGENLIVEGLPQPFVLSEFLESDPAKYDFLPEEFIEGFQQGLNEGLSEVERSDETMSDIEIVVDANNTLYESYDEIAEDKMGAYFFGKELVYVDPNMYEKFQNGDLNFEDLGLPQESAQLSEEEFPKKVTLTYEEMGVEEFNFDKATVIDFWNNVDGKIIGFIGFVAFFMILFVLVVLRLITNVFWTLVSWAIVALIGYKTDFVSLYLANLNVLVLVTLIELILLFAFGGVVFSTLACIVVLAIIYGLGSVDKTVLQGDSVSVDEVVSPKIEGEKTK